MWRRSATSSAVMAVLAALLVFGGLAGCDDGATSLSMAAFQSKANAECATLQQASDQLRSAADPSATGRRVTSFVSKGADILRERLDAIDALSVDGKLADQRDELVSALHRYADRLEQLGKQAEPGESFADLESTHQDAIKSLNELAAKASTVAGQLGLTQCLAGTP